MARSPRTQRQKRLAQALPLSKKKKRPSPRRLLQAQELAAAASRALASAVYHSRPQNVSPESSSSTAAAPASAPASGPHRPPASPLQSPLSPQGGHGGSVLRGGGSRGGDAASPFVVSPFVASSLRAAAAAKAGAKASPSPATPRRRQLPGPTSTGEPAVAPGLAPEMVLAEAPIVGPNSSKGGNKVTFGQVPDMFRMS